MAKLSVPSYIIPGTYLENIRFIDRVEMIDNVELLFFLFDNQTQSLLREEIDGIRDFAGRFTYTVHMPDPLNADHKALLNMMRPIADRFVVHTPCTERVLFLQTLEEWASEFGNVFQIENVVGCDFQEIALAMKDAPICCDTGHLLLEGKKPVEFIDYWGHRIGEIHLHGTFGGKDHQAVNGNESWFEELGPYLEQFAGIIHLELFQYDKLVPMIDLLSRYRRVKE